MTQQAPLHLAVALDGTGWHPASWREPGARADELFTAGFWVDQVREAEAGLLDGRRATTHWRHAAELARQMGYEISNADVTLICERPKVKPHRQAMRDRIAGLLGLPLDAVSVKATTSERLGFTGREEGIAALATATLIRRD